MAWKCVSLVSQRLKLVRAYLSQKQTLSALVARFGVSRTTGYKWVERFLAGGPGALQDRSSRPRSSPTRMAEHWLGKIRRARRKHPSWGPQKIRTLLRPSAQGAPPSVRTIGRCLKALGLTPRRRVRARRGPLLESGPFTVAEAPNDVWTFDFKGWFRAGGERVEPLTVRDLFSRYILGIFLLQNQSDQAVRACCQRLFARYGVPGVIRVDNGSPFGGVGALGLSRLSLWWLSLGIKVEFSRRGHPEDNAAHEQMHRIYKEDTANPPASSVARQQRRTRHWIRYYNYQRPHEALGQKKPGDLYRSGQGRQTRDVPDPDYPSGWPTRRAGTRGSIKWEGRLRHIGRAFIGQKVGLKKIAPGVYAIYFGLHLIGHLHAEDAGGMRPARHKMFFEVKAQCKQRPGIECQ